MSPSFRKALRLALFWTHLRKAYIHGVQEVAHGDDRRVVVLRPLIVAFSFQEA